MAPPPSFGDLDKQIRDLFSKGYNYGFWKFDCKSKTENAIDLSSSGQKNNESGKVGGFIEAKRKFFENNLTLSEKWTIDHILNTEVTLDKLVEGFKLVVTNSFAPSSGDLKFKVKAAYGYDYFKIDADSTVNSSPLINLAAVVGYEGFNFGYQTGFTTEDNSFTTHNLAASYATKEFVVHVGLTKLDQIFTSVFYKVNDQLDLGAQLSWVTDPSEIKVGLGTKVQLDEDACIRAKINNACQLGLGYQQKVHPGITLSLSTLLNVKDLNSEDHKIGAAMEFEI